MVLVKSLSRLKSPYGGTLSQPGGEGVKKDVKCPNLKYLFTRELFLEREGVKLVFPFPFLNKEVKRKFLTWKVKF